MGDVQVWIDYDYIVPYKFLGDLRLTDSAYKTLKCLHKKIHVKNLIIMITNNKLLELYYDFRQLVTAFVCKVSGTYTININESHWVDIKCLHYWVVSSCGFGCRNKKNENIKGIPEFWLVIFKNVGILSEMVQEHDEPILQYLRDITVQLTDNPMVRAVFSFCLLTFYFFNDPPMHGNLL